MMVGLILLATGCWLGDFVIAPRRFGDLLVVVGSIIFVLALGLLVGLSIGSEISETSGKVLFGLLVLGIAAPVFFKRRPRQRG